MEKIEGQEDKPGMIEYHNKSIYDDAGYEFKCW